MPAPLEYVELHLCREFHKLPSEIRKEKVVDILQILAMEDVEGIVQKKRGRKRGR